LASNDSLSGKLAAMTKLCGLRERKKEQTRLALVDAALTLFETKGFEAATV